MKIITTLELEVPDEWSKWSEAELRQEVFDSTLQACKDYHGENALKYLATKDPGPAEVLALIIYKRWLHILSNAKFDMTLK
jgi:hypothetical protein